MRNPCPFHFDDRVRERQREREIETQTETELERVWPSTLVGLGCGVSKKKQVKGQK